MNDRRAIHHGASAQSMDGVRLVAPRRLVARRRARPAVPGPGLASATFVLPPHAASVHSARSFATGALTGWGLGELADNMELVVSELATNALRHGLRLSRAAAAIAPSRCPWCAMDHW